MAATSTPKMSALSSTLAADYPQLIFREGAEFRWNALENCVYYTPGADDFEAYLLHETSHGLLAHSDYTLDIELLDMERAAWQKARQLAAGYGTKIDETIIDGALESYRDWLHRRSTCPACRATGLQASKHTYHCLACQSDWRVNEARTCRLQRHLQSKNPS